jgi:hypothetical protein
MTSATGRRAKKIGDRDEKEVLDKARSLRHHGHDWKTVCIELDIGYDWLRTRIDPDYCEYRKKKRRRELHITTSASGSHMSQAEYLQRRRSVPKDTRNLTQRLMGDPLPGRSALDMREEVQ